MSSDKSYEFQTRVYTAVKNLDCSDVKTSYTYEMNIKDSEGEVKFHLQARVLNRGNNYAEIYYRTPKSLSVRAILTLVEPEKTIAMTEHTLIPANRWQHLSTIKDSDVDKNGKLCIKFQFFVIEDRVEDAFAPIPRLSTDLGSLLDSGLLTDVVLNSCDDVEHKAHKVVLSRCPVLRAALEHGMEEKETDIINSPFESEILEQVLKFIYTDKAPGIRELGEKLLVAADYYQLSLLKCLCEQALCEQITTENCLAILNLADAHSAPCLKKVALEFVDKKAKELIKTKSWKNLDNIDIIKAMYEMSIVGDESVNEKDEQDLFVVADRTYVQY